MGNELLTIKNLKRTFVTESGEQNILNGIDVTINKGDFAVIMGSSGSGKSTFLYSISGMDTPTSGEIIFNGTDMTKLSSDQLAFFRRKHCGFVFQQICLIDSLTVMDNVMAAGLLVSKDRKAVYERACKLLESVDVEKHSWSKFPNQISGGRAQRVGIIRALINNPEILFADEPTGALNSQTSGEVLDNFTKCNRNGQTIVMVTHDTKSALRGNRVLYLRDGKLLDECVLGQYQENDISRNEKLSEFLKKMEW